MAIRRNKQKENETTINESGSVVDDQSTQQIFEEPVIVTTLSEDVTPEGENNMPNVDETNESNVPVDENAPVNEEKGDAQLSDEEEKPKTFNEQLDGYLKKLNEDNASGQYPFALALLSMWSGLSPSFHELEEIHKKLTNTGPSDSEMREKRAKSDDDEVKAWNAEIEELEKQIAALKLKANEKIEGPNFVQPLSLEDKEIAKKQFGDTRAKVKSAIDGFAAVVSMNNDYMKEFTDFLSANIPDLRSSGSKTVAKAATSGTGDGRGRKPAFSEMAINHTAYDKLQAFRGILASGYGIARDAYGLRVLAEMHGASADNPVVEFQVSKKHSSETVPLRIGVNYDAGWDEDKLRKAKESENA